MARLQSVLQLIVTLFVVMSSAAPSKTALMERTDPYFPDSPPSCQICAPAWPGISSCAAAAGAFQNFSQIFWDPSSFISVIKCSCTDTFQSAFPQCADCFQLTNQTDVLNIPNLPSAVSGLRQVCGFASVLLGKVASTNRQLPSETPINPQASTSAARLVVSGLPTQTSLMAAMALIGLAFGTLLVL